MSRSTWAFALAAGAISAPAFGQWYVGVGPGVSNARVGGTSGAITLSARDSHNTSIKLFGGYQFSPHWGAELQYADLGRFGYSACQAAACATGSAHASQWGLAGTGTWTFANRYYLAGKLGVTQSQVRGGDFCVAAACAVGATGTRGDLLAGIGVGYNFTHDISMRLEFEHFGKLVSGAGFAARGENWAATLRYSF